MQKQTFEEIYEWVNSFSRQDSIFSPINAFYDFKITNGVLSIGKTLETPIMMSIFCHKYAEEFEVSNEFFRRSHNTELLQAEGHEVGSLLWLYTEKRVIDSDDLPIIQDDLMRATSFLVEQNQVKDIDIVCTHTENRKLSISVTTTPKAGIQPFAKDFLI